jgi:hypothetical protein
MSTSSRLSRHIAVAFLTLAVSVASRADDALRYLSGGIGESGIQEMQGAASGYSTMLTFADKTGAYLADVDVTIKSPHGDKLVSTVTKGPILLVDLPAGHYQVLASFEGRSVTRDIDVPAKGHKREVVHL